MSYDSFVLARADLAAYFKLETGIIPSPTSLSFPGTDSGAGYNRLSTALSLTSGQTIAVHITGALSGGSNPNIGLISVAGGQNVYSPSPAGTGWFTFLVSSTQSDYYVYSYSGGSYQAGMTGTGTYGIGGADKDAGPNNLGYLSQASNATGNKHPQPGQATMLGGGQVGGSTLFSGGSSERLEIPDSASLDLADTWTVGALIKSNSLSGIRGIASKGSGAYYLRTNSTDLELVRSLTAVVATSTGTLATSTRYFVVGTKSGSTRKLYVDAVDVTDTLPSDSTCANNASRLMIGQDSGGSEYFSGYIERLFLLNAAMSGADVALLYAEIDTPTGGGSTIPGFQAIVIG